MIMRTAASARTIVRVLFASCAAVLACAACTSTATHPSEVTWGDLIEGDRLEAYLKSREADLKRLEAESASLTTQLSKSQASLDSVERALAAAEKTAKGSDAELVALRADVSRANEQLASARGRAADLEIRIAGLRAELKTLNHKTAVQERIAKNEVQLERLQGEVAMLERAVERTLVVRARHALQTEAL
jgi:chromosome segregation ATPase